MEVYEEDDVTSHPRMTTYAEDGVVSLTITIEDFVCKCKVPTQIVNKE